jgi:CheY-like chemotaxis protein
VDQIIRAGHRARELVNQILAFTRDSEQKQTPLRIGPIVKETLKMLRASLPAHIDILQQLSAEHDTVLAVPTEIHQVLLNLYSNAVNAMQDRGGRLTVCLGEATIAAELAQSLELQPGGYVKLTVTDTGRGMSPETLRQIFDPCFTTKAPGEGTGIGLAIVANIIKRCGGTIEVSSELDLGSSFTVYLPRVRFPAPSKSKHSSPPPRGTERILLVDDEVALVQAEQAVLEKLGYRVVTCTSSTHALKLFTRAPDDFDLVISDQMMPNLTGIELVKEMTRIRSTIPVILCTGFSQTLNSITPDEAKSLGIEAVVMKPILMDEIARTIRSVLDRRKP